MNRKITFSRSKQKLGRPEEIKPVIERYLQKYASPDLDLLIKLWQHWEMVMGEDIAPLAAPLGHKEGVLYVGAEDAISAQELSYMNYEILDRANAFMHKNFFKDVKVRLHLDKKDLHQIASNPKLMGLGQKLTLEATKLNGANLANIPSDSPVARCYARFVEASKKRNEQS